MIPARAREIAEENGCTFRPSIKADGFWIDRDVKIANYEKFIRRSVLQLISEPDFIAFYLPDERD